MLDLYQDDNEEGDVSPFGIGEVGSATILGNKSYALKFFYKVLHINTGCEIPGTSPETHSIPQNSFIYEHKKCRLCSCTSSGLICKDICK